MLFIIYIVPDPIVNVTPLATQIVGQSLTLECSGTTVRGITSNVVFEWRHDRSTVNFTSVPTATMGSLLVYRVSYTIPQLTTSDDDERYNCRFIIDASPQVRVMQMVILDVTGEYFNGLIFYFTCFLQEYVCVN